MTPDVNADHLGAARASVAKRSAKAELKKAVARGTVTVADVIRHPKPYTADVLLWELVCWRRGWGRSHLRRLNGRAIAARVNLAVPLGDSTERQRDWLIDAMA